MGCICSWGMISGRDSSLSNDLITGRVYTFFVLSRNFGGCGGYWCF